MPRLSQIIALEPDVKQAASQLLKETAVQLGSGAALSGLIRRYEPLADDGERQPEQSKKVQVIARDVVNELRVGLRRLFDIEATKDVANTRAKADIVLDDGTVLVKDAPTTYMLWLETQLDVLEGLINRIPALPMAESWNPEGSTGLWITGPVVTAATKRKQVPFVLHPGTDKHPPQVERIEEDVTVGHWTNIQRSGAMPVPVIKEMLGRVRELKTAVKKAREEANRLEAPDVKPGKELLDYIFGIAE